MYLLVTAFQMTRNLCKQEKITTKTYLGCIVNKTDKFMRL